MAKFGQIGRFIANALSIRSNNSQKGSLPGSPVGVQMTTRATATGSASATAADLPVSPMVEPAASDSVTEISPVSPASGYGSPDSIASPSLNPAERVWSALQKLIEPRHYDALIAQVETERKKINLFLETSSTTPHRLEKEKASFFKVAIANNIHIVTAEQVDSEKYLGAMVKLYCIFSLYHPFLQKKASNALGKDLDKFLRKGEELKFFSEDINHEIDVAAVISCLQEISGKLYTALVVPGQSPAKAAESPVDLADPLSPSSVSVIPDDESRLDHLRDEASQGQGTDKTVQKRLLIAHLNAIDFILSHKKDLAALLECHQKINKSIDIIRSWNTRNPSDQMESTLHRLVIEGNVNIVKGIADKTLEQMRSKSGTGYVTTSRAAFKDMYSKCKESEAYFLSCTSSDTLDAISWSATWTEIHTLLHAMDSVSPMPHAAPPVSSSVAAGASVTNDRDGVDLDQEEATDEPSSPDPIGSRVAAPDMSSVAGSGTVPSDGTAAEKERIEQEIKMFLESCRNLLKSKVSENYVVLQYQAAKSAFTAWNLASENVISDKVIIDELREIGQLLHQPVLNTPTSINDSDSSIGDTPPVARRNGHVTPSRTTKGSFLTPRVGTGLDSRPMPPFMGSRRYDPRKVSGSPSSPSHSFSRFSPVSPVTLFRFPSSAAPWHINLSDLTIAVDDASAALNADVVDTTQEPILPEESAQRVKVEAAISFLEEMIFERRLSINGDFVTWSNSVPSDTKNRRDFIRQGESVLTTANDGISQAERIAKSNLAGLLDDISGDIDKKSEDIFTELEAIVVIIHQKMNGDLELIKSRTPKGHTPEQRKESVGSLYSAVCDSESDRSDVYTPRAVPHPNRSAVSVHSEDDTALAGDDCSVPDEYSFTFDSEGSVSRPESRTSSPARSVSTHSEHDVSDADVNDDDSDTYSSDFYAETYLPGALSDDGLSSSGHSSPASTDHTGIRVDGLSSRLANEAIESALSKIKRPNIVGIAGSGASAADDHGDAASPRPRRAAPAAKHRALDRIFRELGELSKSVSDLSGSVVSLLSLEPAPGVAAPTLPSELEGQESDDGLSVSTHSDAVGDDRVMDEGEAELMRRHLLNVSPAPGFAVGNSISVVGTPPPGAARVPSVTSPSVPFVLNDGPRVGVSDVDALSSAPTLTHRELEEVIIEGLLQFSNAWRQKNNLSQALLVAQEANDRVGNWDAAHPNNRISPSLRTKVTFAIGGAEPEVTAEEYDDDLDYGLGHIGGDTDDTDSEDDDRAFKRLDEARMIQAVQEENDDEQVAPSFKPLDDSLNGVEDADDAASDDAASVSSLSECGAASNNNVINTAPLFLNLRHSRRNAIPSQLPLAEYDQDYLTDLDSDLEDDGLDDINDDNDSMSDDSVVMDDQTLIGLYGPVTLSSGEAPDTDDSFSDWLIDPLSSRYLLDAIPEETDGNDDDVVVRRPLTLGIDIPDEPLDEDLTADDDTIESPAPTTPVSTTPVSTTPVSTRPVPTTPVPTTPVSTTPVPTRPVPTTPVPTTPVPTTPVSTTPAPTIPAPTIPAPMPPGLSDYTNKMIKLAAIILGKKITNIAMIKKLMSGLEWRKTTAPEEIGVLNNALRLLGAHLASVIEKDKKKKPAVVPPVKKETTLEDEINRLEAYVRETYAANHIIMSAALGMTAAVRKENKNHPDEQKWKKRVTMTHDLLAGRLSPDDIHGYHQEALTLNRDKRSKAKKIIGACMIVLAVAFVAAAVVAVPFLSLAIVGVAALSSTMATAIAAVPFGLGAAASGLGGGLFFRKTAVTRQMLALEQEKARELKAVSPS